MPNFIQITPFLHVPDLERAVAFFTDLGFEVQLRTADYAYVEREVVGIRILQASGSDNGPKGDRRFAHYIDVRDVDGLFAELKPKLDALPKGDVYGPVNQAYGQRELLVVAPDGDLLVFGQAIESAGGVTSAPSPRHPVGKREDPHEAL